MELRRGVLAGLIVSFFPSCTTSHSPTLPSLVAVEPVKGAGRSCVGVAISSTKVLTAKHCLHGTNLRVRTMDRRTQLVSGVTISSRVDVGVARLDEPLPERVRTAKLSSGSPKHPFVTCSQERLKPMSWERWGSDGFSCKEEVCFSAERYIPAGASGCPVVNPKGDVIAITSSWSAKGAYFVRVDEKKWSSYC